MLPPSVTYGSYVLTVSVLAFLLGLAALTSFLCAPGVLGLIFLGILGGLLVWATVSRAAPR